MLATIEKSINQRYGSKRGWLNHQKAALAGLAGRWRPYRQVDWNRVERLVFVCMGNICRSALAEGVARAAGYNAKSCGIQCTPGMPADPRAIRFAERHGYDLSGHRTTRLQDFVVEPTDLVIGMEPRHLRLLLNQNQIAGQLTLLGLWHMKPTAYIHDPYSTNELFFEGCEKFVLESTWGLLEKKPQL